MKQAWIDLRYEFPSIATSYRDGCRHYTVAEKELEDWLTETFVVTSEDAEKIPEHATRVERTKLYLIPEKQEIVVQSLHSLLDGMGILLLLDGLFRHLSNPTATQTKGEIARLPLAMAEAGGIIGTESGAASVRAAAQKVKEAQPSIGVSPINIDHLPSNSQRRFIQFSKTETTAILGAIKQNGWSVGATIHVAVYEAVSVADAGENATGVICVDFRPRLGARGQDRVIVTFLRVP
jgi:hypothetical protein